MRFALVTMLSHELRLQLQPTPKDEWMAHEYKFKKSQNVSKGTRMTAGEVKEHTTGKPAHTGDEGRSAGYESYLQR